MEGFRIVFFRVKMKNIYLLIWTVLWLSGSYAQTVTMDWYERPGLKHHFYEMNTADTGLVYFYGLARCTAANPPALARILLFKNAIPIDTIETPISFSGDSAFVSFPIAIHGELAMYKTLFQIGAYSYTADSIACGISILCNGQSNMVGGPTQMGGTNAYIPPDPYVLTFGNTSNPASPPGLNFNIANPNTNYANHSTGNLAFRIAKTLRDSLEIPICVLNGAYGGATILQHQRNDTFPQDLNTLYGKLLFRFNKARLIAPKAFFWYQGESDVIAPLGFDSLLYAFFHDLTEDYGSQMAMVLVQIHRESCNNTIDAALKIQNYQLHSDTVAFPIFAVVSSNGKQMRWDHCHHEQDGYLSLGYSLAKTYLKIHKGENPYDKLIPKPLKIIGEEGGNLINIITSANIDSQSVFLTETFFRIRKILPNQTFQTVFLDSLMATRDTIKIKISETIDSGEVFEVAYIGSEIGLDTFTIRSLEREPLLSFSQLVDCVSNITTLNITTSCASYALNGTTYTVSGVYEQYFPIFQSCDSIVRLYLTLINNPDSILNVISCGSYSFQDSVYTLSTMFTQSFVGLGGCDSTFTLNLIILPPPNTNIAVLGNAITSMVSGATYQWINCLEGYSVIENATQQVFTSIQNGSYAVIITQNGCTDTSACATITDFEEIGKTSSPRLFPNPVLDNLELDLGVFYPEIQIEIKNILGEEVYEEAFYQRDKVEINPDIPKGIYLFYVKIGTLHWRSLLVKL